ncbi:hypothetical protein QYE76_049304 [Lolium multiflorum]|uniref:Reverse transcriptase domain-containing protein n=1 Tax=Lolium multiflorum TaxID=4521 RepID=A0AAD8SNN8_LOLMU|nr:hypothetical protein QYE76_049304 [Lolium multiflorum]
MMQKCLAEQIGKNVQVYIDDVVITSKKGDTLIEDLKETFDNLDKFCLKLNPTKCSFGVPAGELLGFLVSARGIEANPEKIQAIVTMRKPTKLKEIHQLTGRVAALSRFVARLGEKALPFYALIKQGDKFQWNEEADRAFEDLKRKISTPPILVAPKEKEPLLLYIAATPQVTSTEENSNGDAESSQRDSSSGNSERSTTQSQTASPAPASEKRSVLEPPAPQAPIKSGSRVKRRCTKRARKDPRASPSSQEVSNTNDTSSGDVEEVLMPSATLDLATSTIVADQVANLAKSTEKPIITTSAAPPTLGEGCDPSSLLTFDPESIEPNTSKASGEPSPSMVHGPLQHLKDLLSSSVETLVDNSEGAKGILEDIQPHLPMTLQVKLWPTATLSVFKSRVQSARQRINLRRTQFPLRADIADKCRRLNEKKAALDAKTDTSGNSAELAALRKELEHLKRGSG